LNGCIVLIERLLASIMLALRNTHKMWFTILHWKLIIFVCHA